MPLLNANEGDGAMVRGPPRRVVKAGIYHQGGVGGVGA